MPGGLQNKIKSINSPEIGSVNIVVVLRYPNKVVIPTGPPRRGLLIGVRDEDGGVGAPTVRKEKPLILRRVIVGQFSFGDEIFFLPGLSYRVFLEDRIF